VWWEISPLTAKPNHCLIIGAGGHARVVIDCIRAAGTLTIFGLLDVDAKRWGTTLDGCPILGGDDFIERLRIQPNMGFILGLGGVRDNRPRLALWERACTAGLTPVSVVHPSAICSPASRLDEGSLVGPGAIINAGAEVGRNVIVNSGAIVEHDCVVGDHVHLATGARLCGTVRVGRLAHIGAGATIRQMLTLGDAAVVAAGAVVVDDVLPGAIVTRAFPPVHSYPEP
jgi:sugar O-acyltransferase (sialic acid O-acetyltransferase NeuD family)